MVENLHPANILNVLRRNKTPEIPEVAHVPFEQQFKNRHKVEVGGAHVEYVRLCPPLDRQSSQVPVIVAPGLTENPDILAKLLKKLYDDGRIVLSPEHNHKVNVEANGHPKVQEKKIQTIGAIINEARSLNPANPNKKVKPHGTVDIIGRSDGGINGTFATAQNPGYVDNLILLDTKLTPPQPSYPFYVGFIHHSRKEGAKAVVKPSEHGHITTGIRRAVIYVAPHLAESIQEIDAIARTDIRDTLRYLRSDKLKKQGKNVHLYYVHGTSDDVMRFDQAEKSLRSELFDAGYPAGIQKSKKSHLIKRSLKDDTGKELDPTRYVATVDENGNFFPVTKKDRNGNDVLDKNGKKVYKEIDFTPINHASVYTNDKYIGVISYALAAARRKSYKEKMEKLQESGYTNGQFVRAEMALKRFDDHQSQQTRLTSQQTA